MPAVLAIDQGTTGSTALVISHSGEILGRAYSEFTQYYPKPGWVEHDAEEIWQVSRRVMATALGDAGLRALHKIADEFMWSCFTEALMWAKYESLQDSDHHQHCHHQQCPQRQ
jgi:sugar (pentulose or hexulose) kinase